MCLTPYFNVDLSHEFAVRRSVDGRAIVIDSSVAQQRQAARAVIRHFKHQRFPTHMTAHKVIGFGAALECNGTLIRVTDQLFSGGGVKAPHCVLMLVRALAQGDYQQARWIEQLR